MKSRAWAALLFLSACSGGGRTIPPVVTPTPPSVVHEPVCVPPGLVVGCWHAPPGVGWQYIPPTSSAPSGCVLSGDPTTPSSDQRNTLGAAVNAAIAPLVPHCTIGADCLINDWTVQRFQAAVEANLRAAGFCAGQHAPSSDEIAVAGQAGQPWQGFHIFSGDDSETVPNVGVRRTVVWSPQSFRGSWLPPAGPASPAPPAPTPGTPNPGPVPPAPPAGDVCPFQPCPPREWTAANLPDGWDRNLIGRPAYKINSHTYPGGRFDSTPVVVRNEPYCRSVGLSRPEELRAECPVRPDGHPQRVAVENWLLYGGPVREGVYPENADSCGLGIDNPFMGRAGTGSCRICNSKPDGDPNQVCTPYY